MAVWVCFRMRHHRTARITVTAVVGQVTTSPQIPTLRQVLAALPSLFLSIRAVARERLTFRAPLSDTSSAGLADMDRTTGERILACLKGIATGDAIGKQTETLSREGVLRWYPDGVRGFEGSPGTPIPRYSGNAKHEWRIGETTDDTERTVAVARAILQDGDVRHASVGREMLTCIKSVHPGVKSLWEFHQAGDPARVTDRHDGCGAAIRVAPVGILYRSGRLEQIVAAAREASVSTHGGALALAAAAATAAAVSAAVDGASSFEIIEIAQRAAVLAERNRSGSATATFAEVIQTVHQDLHQSSELRPAEVAARYFPNGPLTIVPLAIALGTVMSSAEAAILLATNIGGDSDSVASIAGAILGARYPDTVNDEWYEVVERVNSHDLRSVAEALSGLRH
jgi:ADP-ribosylglycohydrolase